MYRDGIFFFDRLVVDVVFCGSRHSEENKKQSYDSRADLRIAFSDAFRLRQSLVLQLRSFFAL